MPAPLDPTRAASIREGQHPVAARRRRRLRVVLAAVVAAAVVVGAVAAVLAFATGNLFAPAPVNLLKIDPATNTIQLELHDTYRDEHLPHALFVVNGALWQGTNVGFNGLVRRRVDTGEVIDKVPVNKEPEALAFGFGSIWLAGVQTAGSIERLDAVSGQDEKTITVPAPIASMDDGPTALWVLGQSGELFRIDPITNAVTGTYDTGTVMPGVVVALGSDVWVCDCEFHRIVQFDPMSNKVVRTLSFAQSGFLVGLTDTAGVTTLWLLDPQGSTLTPIDEQSGKAGQPIGVGENLHDAVVAFGSVWLAAGDKVLRIAGNGPEVQQRFLMPKGMSAGSIAADPKTGNLWVADCGCPIQ